MSALQRWPIVSALMAALFLSAPLLQGDARSPGIRKFESARSEARNYWVSHPRLEVDAMGELMLGPTWLEEARAAAESSRSDFDIEPPSRLLARSQTKLDGLVEEAYHQRMQADPAWRYGVLNLETPPANYYAHAFFPENGAGVLLCLLILLLAGAPLERSWGKFVYLTFVVAAIPATAMIFRVVDAASGVPWSGGAGLAGAILGAYFIRGLGGHFVVPGWVLLSGWLAVETVVVRNFWIDDLDRVPWTTLFAAVGIGAFVSGFLRLVGVESKMDSRSGGRDSLAPNPIVSRAARLRSDGNAMQAFDLLQAAWRENPLDEEIAEAFFLSAVEVDRPNAASEAILPSLRQALRKNDLERALEYWVPLAQSETSILLDAPASVRLGEALLAAGYQDEAVFSFQGAIDAGVSPAHADRIVGMALDVDAGIARHAATIALCDSNLRPNRRSELEAIAHPADVMQRAPATGDAPGAAGVESDFLSGLSSLETERGPVAEAENDPEAQLARQALDVGALDPEALSTSISDDIGLDDDGSADLLDADGLDLDGIDLGEDLFALEDDGQSELDGRDELFDVDSFRDLSETDSDLTPLMAASADFAIGDGTRPESPERPSTVPAQAADAQATPSAAAGPVAESAGDEPPLRPLKALVAVPLESDGTSLEIDVEGRGKSRLPLDRIQAISMAAIEGLGSRSVLVVDFVLNWEGAREEPMKVIRFRSDRFDPRRFEPAEIEPLHALSAWVRRLQVRSEAQCLPDRQFLEGLFLHFDSIAAYEAYVLMAQSD